MNQQEFLIQNASFAETIHLKRDPIQSPKIALSEDLDTYIFNKAFNWSGKVKGPGRLSNKRKQDEADKVIDYLTKRTLVPIESPGVTHILIESWDDDDFFALNVFQPQQRPEDADLYLGTKKSVVVEVGGYSLVHLNLKKRSEDLWVKDEDLTDVKVEENANFKEGIWNCSLRWIHDSILNDEWMYEFDYDGTSNPNPSKKKRKQNPTTIITPKPPPKKKQSPKYNESDSEESVKSSVSKASSNSIDFYVEKKAKDSGSEFEEDDSISGDKDSDGSISAPEDDDSNLLPVDPEEHLFNNFVDNDLFLRPGEKRRRVSEDEDDGLMEPIPLRFVNEDEGVYSWPTVELVDLDYPLMARQTRFEFEPVQGGVFKNVSYTKASCGWTRFYNEEEFIANVNMEENVVDTNDIKMEVSMDIEVDSTILLEPTFPQMEEKLHAFPVWFNQTIAHDLEKDLFSDFFSHEKEIETTITDQSTKANLHPLKTSEFYIALRNKIIKTYNHTPHVYLSAMACFPFIAVVSKKLKGEVFELPFEDLVKLFLFLESKGLINYGVLDFDNQSEIKTFTDLKEITNLKKKIFDHSPTTPTTPSHKKWLDSLSTFTATPPTTSPHISVPGHQYTCFICATVSYNIRFRGLYPKIIVLCPNCYKDGIFPSTMKGSDFARVEGPAAVSNLTSGGEEREWSLEETLALVEGIELYDLNWRKVADYVGSRSVEECICWFVKVPIGEEGGEDLDFGKSYDQVGGGDEEDGVVVVGKGGEVTASYKIPKANFEKVFEFYEGSENPLISFLSTLSKAVNQGVSAAGAKRALDKVQKLMDLNIENEKQHQIDILNNVTTGGATATHRTTQKTQLKMASLELIQEAVGGAVDEARLLAKEEDCRVERLVRMIVELELRVVEEKMKTLKCLNQHQIINS